MISPKHETLDYGLLTGRPLAPTPITPTFHYAEYNFSHCTENAFSVGKISNLQFVYIFGLQWLQVEIGDDF